MEWTRTATRARRFSLAYLGLEVGLAIIAAVLAGSVALLGIDSAIGGLASVIIVRRFSGARTLPETAEARARKAVAGSFFLLAPYIAIEAIITLVANDHAETSGVGIALSAFAVAWMPILGKMKQQLGRQLSSETTAGEGTQNLRCVLRWRLHWSAYCPTLCSGHGG